MYTDLHSHTQIRKEKGDGVAIIVKGTTSQREEAKRLVSMFTDTDTQRKKHKLRADTDTDTDTDTVTDTHT